MDEMRLEVRNSHGDMVFASYKDGPVDAREDYVYINDHAELLTQAANLLRKNLNYIENWITARQKIASTGFDEGQSTPENAQCHPCPDT